MPVCFLIMDAETQEDDGVDARACGIGAQILTDLGVHDMVLLSNSHQMLVGLAGHGLNVVDRQPVRSAHVRLT